MASIARTMARIKDDARGLLDVDLVTTLLDPRKYPKEDLAELYGSRWEVET